MSKHLPLSLTGMDLTRVFFIVVVFIEIELSFKEKVSIFCRNEEEAKRRYTLFVRQRILGLVALMSEELSYKVKGLPGVLWVLPDSYLDVPNKDYGGDLFIDGKVIHRLQYRFTDRQQNNRSRPLPRYDRRWQTMQVERREPLQRQNWAQHQSAPMYQPKSMNNQNPAKGEGTNFSKQG